MISRTQLVLGAGALGGLALLAGCAFDGDDSDSTRTPKDDDPHGGGKLPGGGPHAGGGKAASGLPMVLEDDRRAAYRMLRESPIGSRILQEAQKAGTKIIYQSNWEFDADPAQAGAFGSEMDNTVWIPYRTVRDKEDLVFTLAHELTHAYQEKYGVLTKFPDRPAEDAPWAPPAIRPLHNRPPRITPAEFEGIQMEAQAYIVEARVAKELGILEIDYEDNFIVRRDLSVMNMKQAVRKIAHDSYYGDRYERGQHEVRIPRERVRD